MAARVGSDAAMVRMAKVFDSHRGELQSQLEEEQGRLTHQALHDALTGLPNRVLFLERIAQSIEAATRRSIHSAVLLRRHRPVQVGQRHRRSRRRRPAVDRGGPAAARRAAARRHRGPPGRRRVRGPLREPLRGPEGGHLDRRADLRDHRPPVLRPPARSCSPRPRSASPSCARATTPTCWWPGPTRPCTWPSSGAGRAGRSTTPTSTSA